jgi:Spy/CpxP family protein refolding chaperone
MRMKTSVMVGAWMMAVTFLVAQPRSKDQQLHAGKQAEKMKTELSLDDTQYASIKSIDEKYASQHRMLWKDSTLAREEKAVKHKALRTNQKNEIDAVLTPEQKTKWSAYKEARAEKRKERMNEQRAKRAERLKTALSLTDDQQTKMQQVNDAFKEKLSALRKDSKITKEQKQAELKKISADHEASIKTILSDQQFTKWKELKQKDKGKHKRKRK